MNILEAFRVVNWIALTYFLVLNSFYLILLICAGHELRRHLHSSWRQTEWRILASKVAPRITVLAPAYNEAAAIAVTVRAFLALQYPNLEVVVVNDGSTDDTMKVLERDFQLIPIHPIYRRRLQTMPVRRLFRSRSYPNLIVADKENGKSKADALNAALNLATGELVCVVDADTLIEPSALRRVVRPFLLESEVIAAGGTIRVVNGSLVAQNRVVAPRVPHNFLAGIQVVEYFRAFLFGRLGWNVLGGNLIVSGGFGVFRRDAVIAAGGYKRDTLGEDLELTLNLRRLSDLGHTAGRVEFVPDPVAWTEVPQTVRTLGRQRDRWHRGLGDVLWRYRRVLFRPRFGTLGMIAYPAYVLEFVAPVVEAGGLLTLAVGGLLGAIGWRFALLFALVAYGYGLILSLAGLLLEEASYRRYTRIVDRLALLGYALIESFGYRQMTVYWRLRGLVKLFRGQGEWGRMQRFGFTTVDSSPKERAAAKGK